MFPNILFFASWKDGILPSRDDVLRESFISWHPYKNYQAATEKKEIIRPKKLHFH